MARPSFGKRNRRALWRSAAEVFRNIRCGKIETVRGDRCAGRSPRLRRSSSKSKLVRGVENFRQFHPNGGEIVHVEEAAVIDFLRRDPPESEPIGLIVQQFDRAHRNCAGRPACR